MIMMKMMNNIWSLNKDKVAKTIGTLQHGTSGIPTH